LDVQITSLAYGPFDNGHVLVGLDNGELLAFDFHTLDRLEKVLVFDDHQAVTQITFDPTNYIFAGGSGGKMVALSYQDKQMHYLYFEVKRETFCTLQIPRQKVPDFKEGGKGGFCCV